MSEDTYSHVAVRIFSILQKNYMPGGMTSKDLDLHHSLCCFFYQMFHFLNQAGLIFSEDEWKAEWDNILRLASTTPRAIPGSVPKNNSCCDNMVTQNM